MSKTLSAGFLWRNWPRSKIVATQMLSEETAVGEYPVKKKARRDGCRAQTRCRKLWDYWLLPVGACQQVHLPKKPRPKPRPD